MGPGAREPASRRPEVTEADCVSIKPMQLRESLDEQATGKASLRCGEARGISVISDDDAVDEIHHEEAGPDDGWVFAQHPRPWNRKSGLGQGIQHLGLPAEVVGTWQEVPEWRPTDCPSAP